MLKQKTSRNRGRFCLHSGPGMGGAKPGYTLIELLLVILIITILTAAVITGMGNSQKLLTFLGVQENLFGMLRNTRTYAVTGRSVPDYNNWDGDLLTIDEQVTPANYGIFINRLNNRVVLFADLRANPSGVPIEGTFQDPGAGNINTYNNSDIILAETTLDSDVQIAFLPASDNVTIFFSPIFADVKFNPALTASTKYLTVKLSLKSIPALKTCYLIHPVAGIPEHYPPDLTCS